MARRRLNTKVFAALVGVIAVGGVAVFALPRFMTRKADPAKLTAEGDSAFSKGEYRVALDAYATAAGVDTRNAAVRVKLGDAFIKLTREDPNYLRAAHQCWLEAIAIDPKHKPALERLIESLWEQVELGAGSDDGMAQVFDDIRSRADKLIAIDPSDARAKVWRHVATIRQWLAAKSIPQETLTLSLEALDELAKSNPSNADVSYYLARAKLQMGVDQMAAKRADLAVGAFGEAGAIMTRAIESGQAKNAAVQFYAYEIFVALARLDPKAAERKYKEKAGDAIAAAAASVTDSTKNFDKITLQWADWLSMDGKYPDARAVREDFYKKHPTNQRGRLIWARTLASRPYIPDIRPDTTDTPEVTKAKADARAKAEADLEAWKKAGGRAPAIAILSEEIPIPKDLVGAGVWIHRELQAQTYSELVNIRLADLSEESDPDKRAQILKSIDDPMEKLRRLAPPKAPKILGLEGKILLAKDKSIEAVQTLEEAVQQFRTGAKDYELMYVLARAYNDRTNQPGSARKLCIDILQENPNGFLPVRVLLAELLIKESKLNEAIAQIEIIRKQSKDYPDLPRLDNMAMLLKGNADPRSIDAILNWLPEKDPSDPTNKTKTNQYLWRKYEYARVAIKPEVQLRLLNDIIANDPKDTRAIITLAQLYKTRDLGERAKELINRGLQINPDDASLKIQKIELDGGTSAEVREAIIAEVNKATKDPFQLQIRLYEVYRAPGGDPEMALAALQAALKLRPDDRGVRDTYFKELLARQRFDEAKQQLDILVKSNPDGVGGRLYLHKYAIDRKDFGQAEKIGVELVEQFAQFAQSWLALAQAQEALGKWNEAIESFNQVLTRQPTNYEAMRALVDTFYLAGRTDDAKNRLREMRTLFSSDVVVRELYLNHLANFGEPEAAISDRETLLKQNPKDPWSYLSLAATYFKNAQKLASDNKIDESEKFLTKAFDTLSLGRTQFPDDTRFYAQVSEIHQYSNNLKLAEEVLQAYAERERSKPAGTRIRPDPWLALADFYSRCGQKTKAVKALDEALVRSDNDLGIRLRLVTAMTQAGQFDDAYKTLDAVSDNKDPKIARQRLEIMISQGSLESAEKQIRATLKTTDSPDIRALLASVLIDTNRPDEALKELVGILARDPRNEAAKYLRAMAYSRKAPNETYIPLAIQELVDLKKSTQTQLPQIRLLLADLYDRSGKRKQAIQELQEALEKNTGSREYRLALVHLYRADRPPQVRQAMELLTRAENDPVMRTDPAWPRESALIWMDQRNYPLAVVSMKKAVDLAPNNLEFRRELTEILIKFNDYAGAIVQTDNLLRDGIDTSWLRMLRGIATGRQVNREMLEASASDPSIKAKVADIQAKATAEFDLALSLAKEDERFALTLRRMGETLGYDPALQRLAPRLINDPDNNWKLLSLAFKRTKGDFAGAIADALQMLNDPSNGKNKPARRVPILRALADTYQSKTPPDFVLARDRYAELLTLNDTDEIAMNNLAFIMAESITPPDPQGAKVYSTQAYNIARSRNDPDPMILDTHGWVLVLCGGNDLRVGTQILQAVVAQTPFMIEGHYHLGEAYLRQNLAGEATKELQEAMRLIEENEKLDIPVDQRLRDKVQTSLGKAREAANIKTPRS